MGNSFVPPPDPRGYPSRFYASYFSPHDSDIIVEGNPGQIQVIQGIDIVWPDSSEASAVACWVNGDSASFWLTPGNLAGYWDFWRGAIPIYADDTAYYANGGGSAAQAVVWGYTIPDLQSPADG